MESYLGQMCSLMQKFEAFLPHSASKAAHDSQQEKLSMIRTLSGLKPEFKVVRHQILSRSTNPTMKDTYKRLFNMASSSSSTGAFTGTPPEASTLMSQILGGNQG